MQSRITLGIGLLACVMYAGCSQEKMEQSAEQTKAAAKDAGEAAQVAGDAAASAKKAAGEAVDAAKDAAKDAAASTQKAAGAAVDAAKDAAKDAAASAKDAAAAAKDSVAGAVEGAAITKDFSEIIASVTKSLTSVKDAASAPAVANKLKESEGTLKGLVEKFKALPPQVKTAVAGAVAKGVEGLKPLAEKVLAIPGVGDTLKPHLDALMSQLAEVKE